MISASKIFYKASWTPSLDSVKPKDLAITQKVIALLKKVIFFIPNALFEPLVRWCVLPSSSCFMKKIFKVANQKFQNGIAQESKDPQPQHLISELEVTTPDGIVLKGHFFKHPKHDQDPQARVVLCFHGNGDFYQNGSIYSLTRLLSSQGDIPYSFVFFNPRGVGNSTQGTPNENTLLIDAESIYQTITNNLKIPESQIDIYGHSLGGAQGAQLKKLHPHTGGGLFLDRTFSKLDKMVSDVMGTSIIGRLAQKIVKKYGWEFNTYEALRNVRDRIYIFTHLQDGMIPKDCSLDHAIETTPLAHTQILSFKFLYSTNGDLCMRPHMDPLPNCYGRGNSFLDYTNDQPKDTAELLLNCFNPARQNFQSQAV